MISNNYVLSLIQRIPRSLAIRKKTYSVRAWAALKHQRKRLKDLGNPQFYIWILGCQRSGTTLLERIFRQDLDSEVFGEFSRLTLGPDKTSLKPFKEVRKKLEGSNAHYCVIRPLFESDRAQEILDFFQPSVAVWMFREPLFVVNSMLNKWGDQFFNISRCVETGLDGKWRLESLYQDIKDEAKQLALNNGNIHDLYALYWLKRNEIVLQPGFQLNKSILLLDYGRLVREPRKWVDTIMKRAGNRGVWKYFSTDAHQGSMNRQINLRLSPEIQERCNALYDKLCTLGKRDFPYEKN